MRQWLEKAAVAARLRAARLIGRSRTAFRHFTVAADAQAAGEGVQIERTREGVLSATLERGGRAVTRCELWDGAFYRRERDYFDLRRGEAELVFLETPPAERGRGHATELLRALPARLAEHGVERAFARVWHSNTPSVRAFQKAGWQDCGVEFFDEGATRVRPRGC